MERWTCIPRHICSPAVESSISASPSLHDCVRPFWSNGVPLLTLYQRQKNSPNESWILSIQSQSILNQAKALLMAMKQDPTKMGFIVKYNPKDGLYVESDPNNPEDGAQAVAALQELAR